MAHSSVRKRDAPQKALETRLESCFLGRNQRLNVSLPLEPMDRNLQSGKFQSQKNLAFDRTLRATQRVAFSVDLNEKMSQA